MTFAVHNAYEELETRYGKLRCFAHDTGAVTQSLRNYGEWAENELSFVKKLIPEGSTVIDAGGYIGTHALAFSHYVGENGKVLSIEPQSETFKTLTHNIETNNRTNVTLINAAISNINGNIGIKPIDIEESVSFGSMDLNRDRLIESETQKQRVAQTEENTLVQTLTIDSLDVATCALIKLDVEGFEDLALKGAAQTLSRTRCAIYAECNSVESGLVTIRIMQAYGYDIYLHIVDAYNPENYRANTENIFDSAREVAILAVHPANGTDFLQQLRDDRERVIKIDTADDIVLGMLNKPQYFGEVLKQCAAKQKAIADPVALLRNVTAAFGVESAQNDVLQQALTETQELAVTRLQRIDQLQQALDETQRLAVERYNQIEMLQNALDETQKTAQERLLQIEALHAAAAAAPKD